MHHFRPLFICHNISHAVLLALIWLNEILDLPYALGIGIKSSANFVELIIESIALLAVYLTSIIILNKICHRIKILEGILPICSSCKKIRNSEDSWENLENYISDKSQAQFSHSLCPDCLRQLYPDLANNILNKNTDAN